MHPSYATLVVLVTDIYTFNQFVSDTITEVMCLNAGQSCGGNPYFSCLQVKSRMQVAYGTIVSEGNHLDMVELTLRNITVNIGCSCSYVVPVMFRNENIVEKK